MRASDWRHDQIIVSSAEQAIWEARSILGFDNDGDPTPAAIIAGMGRAGYCRMFLQELQDWLTEHLEELAEAEARAERGDDL